MVSNSIQLPSKVLAFLYKGRENDSEKDQENIRIEVLQPWKSPFGDDWEIEAKVDVRA
jgi:hypothetical protein